eukprot:6195998-Pleurochrysis_carterae.AAC.5
MRLCQRAENSHDVSALVENVIDARFVGVGVGDGAAVGAGGEDVRVGQSCRPVQWLCRCGTRAELSRRVPSDVGCGGGAKKAGAAGPEALGRHARKK